VDFDVHVLVDVDGFLKSNFDPAPSTRHYRKATGFANAVIV
jgi:hypothetical protein